MRIRGTGSTNSSSTGPDNARATAFRKSHQIGQTVQGRVLRHAGSGLAWVNFGSVPLLAQIGSTPPVGARLTFQVQQLYPDIILKEYTAQGGAATGLGKAVQDFHTARAAFEAGLDALPPLPQGEKRFRSALSQQLGENLAQAEQCLALVNACLAGKDSRQLSYLPWLLPEARENELLIWKKTDASMSEAVLGFRLEPFGALQFRAMLRSPLLRYRIYADRPQGAERLGPLLQKGLGLHEWDMACLGSEVLPKRFRGGLLAELLAPLP
ncbi:MAG: hypothetical protein V3573_06130 [Desulfovibrionaceae bacterium]